MSARIVPTMPDWTSHQVVTSALLEQITTYGRFWANPPAFRMTQQIAQSIPNAIWTQVTCDTLDYDTDSGRALTSPWSYTIPVGMTGRWQFGWMLPWVDNTTGTRDCEIRKNGNNISSYVTYAPVGSGGSGGQGWTDPIAVAAGDVMSMWGYQSITSGALSTSVQTDTFPVFWGRLFSLANP